jgi:ribosomal protein S6
MRKYEIALLFDAGLAKAKLEKQWKDFESFVTENKGRVMETDLWPPRDLAYPIKQAGQGIYYFAHYELAEERNDALRKELNLNPHLLRYLITIPPQDITLKGKPKVFKKVQPVKKPLAPKIEKKEVKAVEPVKIKETPVKEAKEVPKTKVIKEEKVQPVKKTVEESKKVKAKEQKAKKVDEKDLDREIDRILSDEDLL